MFTVLFTCEELVTDMPHSISSLHIHIHIHIHVLTRACIEEANSTFSTSKLGLNKVKNEKMVYLNF